MTRLLHDLVTDAAARRPEATAIVDRGRAISYGDLDETSSRLASALAERGVVRGSRVCMLLPKTPDAVACILGILKAGGSYVPLDPAGPASRVGKMLASCDDRFLLASSASGGLVSELLTAPPRAGRWCVGWMEHGSAPRLEHAEVFSLEEVSATPPGSSSRLDGDDLAYIMFTSGSTGMPKGVTVTHGNVLAFLDWAVEYFDIAPDDRNSSHPPLHFDLSVFDLFGSLAAGAELHLVPKSLNLLAPAMVRFISDSELTQWFSVPSVLNLIMNADCLEENAFPALKRLMWCGEVLPTPTLRYFMARLPHVTFTNLYGPTEATIASSYYTVPRMPESDREDIPIGTPCAGEALVVLDDDLAPAPVDRTGELYIAGVGLSPGYWRDADKTAAAFVTADVDGAAERVYRTGDLAWRDADGLFHYAGRADTQIKSRGYRIELGEIESVLLALDGLEEAAVVAIRTEGFEAWTICCAYVPADDGADASSIARELRERLPSYMIPQRWLEYERLPTNANGKIDRPRLKADFEGRAELAR